LLDSTSYYLSLQLLMMKILDVVIERTKKNANNVRLEYGSSFKHLFCIIYLVEDVYK